MATPVFMLVQLIQGAITLFTLVLLARVLVSWFQPRPRPGAARQLLGALYAVTDPILDAVRRAVPFAVVGNLDLSPILVLFAVQLVGSVVTGALLQLA